MEDYSRNENVKPEKQRSFLVSMYIYVCIHYIFLLKFAMSAIFLEKPI